MIAGPCKVIASPCNVIASPCNVIASPCKETAGPCKETAGPCNLIDSPCNLIASQSNVIEGWVVIVKIAKIFTPEKLCCILLKEIPVHKLKSLVTTNWQSLRPCFSGF